MVIHPSMPIMCALRSSRSSTPPLLTSRRWLLWPRRPSFQQRTSIMTWHVAYNGKWKIMEDNLKGMNMYWMIFCWGVALGSLNYLPTWKFDAKVFEFGKDKLGKLPYLAHVWWLFRISYVSQDKANNGEVSDDYMACLKKLQNIVDEGLSLEALKSKHKLKTTEGDMPSCKMPKEVSENKNVPPTIKKVFFEHPPTIRPLRLTLAMLARQRRIRTWVAHFNTMLQLSFNTRRRRQSHPWQTPPRWWGMPLHLWMSLVFC